jgi:hypothetical protein
MCWYLVHDEQAAGGAGKECGCSAAGVCSWRYVLLVFVVCLLYVCMMSKRLEAREKSVAAQLQVCVQDALGYAWHSYLGYQLPSADKLLYMPL